MNKRALLAPLLCALLGAAQAETITLDKTIQAKGEMTLSFRCDGGKVELFRNEENECHVWVEYDQQRCRTEVNYDEDSRTLELFIDHDNWEMTKKSGDDKSRFARVRVGLPAKADLNLDLLIKAGELNMTLGDLHIQSFEVRSYAGESHVDFDKPNRCEMKTFDVDFKVGKVELTNLGNANFSEADINSSVGEMVIDFNGEKIRRAMARIDLEIGETTVIVPEDIGVKVKVSKFLFLSSVDYPNWFTQEGSYYYSRNYDKEKDSLYLVISTGIGGLKMRVDKREDH